MLILQFRLLALNSKVTTGFVLLKLEITPFREDCEEEDDDDDDGEEWCRDLKLLLWLVSMILDEETSTVLSVIITEDEDDDEVCFSLKNPIFSKSSPLIGSSPSRM